MSILAAAKAWWVTFNFWRLELYFPAAHLQMWVHAAVQTTRGQLELRRRHLRSIHLARSVAMASACRFVWSPWQLCITASPPALIPVCLHDHLYACSELMFGEEEKNCFQQQRGRKESPRGLPSVGGRRGVPRAGSARDEKHKTGGMHERLSGGDMACCKCATHGNINWEQWRLLPSSLWATVLPTSSPWSSKKDIVCLHESPGTIVRFSLQPWIAVCRRDCAPAHTSTVRDVRMCLGCPTLFSFFVSFLSFSFLLEMTISKEIKLNDLNNKSHFHSRSPIYSGEKDITFIVMQCCWDYSKKVMQLLIIDYSSKKESNYFFLISFTTVTEVINSQLLITLAKKKKKR